MKSCAFLYPAAFLAAFLLGTPAVLAQSGCGPRHVIVSALTDGHGESAVGRGVTKEGSVLELHLSPDGTFTFIETMPWGISCIINFGTAWEFAPLSVFKQFGPRM